MPDHLHMTLEDYLELVARLPRPTAEQTRAFAAYVSEAHSWYKHLPLFGRGVPFWFYVDPCAGMDCTISPEGELSATLRTRNGWHYAMLPTEEYRGRFGYLAYSPLPPPSRSVPRKPPQAPNPPFRPGFLDVERQAICLLPSEVLACGEAAVSGFCHRRASRFLVPAYGRSLPETYPWPVESGGAHAYAVIRRCCLVLSRDPAVRQSLPMEALYRPDSVEAARFEFQRQAEEKALEVLETLLELERQRQLAGMIAAMERVQRRLWGDA